MSRARKIAIVAGLQVLVLLSILAFGQWTVWTADTVQLRLASPSDPQQLDRPPPIEYEISTLDLSAIAPQLFADSGGVQKHLGEEVYVELARRDDGTWGAVGVHEGRHHSRDGTALIRGRLAYYADVASHEVRVMYDSIDFVIASESTLARMPSGSGHDIRVEARVNRFGHATPLRFVVDGQRYPLERP